MEYTTLKFNGSNYYPVELFILEKWRVGMACEGRKSAICFYTAFSEEEWLQLMKQMGADSDILLRCFLSDGNSKDWRRIDPISPVAHQQLNDWFDGIRLPISLFSMTYTAFNEFIGSISPKGIAQFEMSLIGRGNFLYPAHMELKYRDTVLRIVPDSDLMPDYGILEVVDNWGNIQHPNMKNIIFHSRIRRYRITKFWDIIETFNDNDLAR